MRPIPTLALLLALVLPQTAGAQVPSPMPVLENFKVLDPDPVHSREFGWSVAHDGETLVVGSRLGWSPQAFLAGSVNVFRQDAFGWTHEAVLTAADGEDHDWFGGAVAIDGDTIVVGARQDIFGSVPSGSAYVFVRTGTQWAQQAHLVGSERGDYDWFGCAVAVDGDTVAVGAWGFDGAYDDTGAVYVFVRSGTTWAEQQLLASNSIHPDQFGCSVALEGDRLVAGARTVTLTQAFQGAVYVFGRTGTTWSEEALLLANAPELRDNLGASVALEGDVLVAGAAADGSPSGTGRALVFQRLGGVWSQTAELVPSDGEADQFFGHAVDLREPRILVGSPGDDLGAGAFTGSAYTFVRDGASWVEHSKLLATDGQPSAYLGFAVALADDQAIAGARWADSSKGAVYVFPFNEHTRTYCTAKLNSEGCFAPISFAGAPSAAGHPFVVTASQVINNKLGLLLYGTQGAEDTPFIGGLLCVSAPRRRTPAQFSGGNPPPSDCSGSFWFDFDAWIQSGIDPSLVPGVTVNAQYWYRDPLSPRPGGLTHAIEFELQP